EPRGGVAPGLVGELLPEEDRPPADHENPRHDRDQADQDDDPDAKTASDLRLADHGRSFETRDSRAAQRPSFARRSGLREGGSAASQSRTGLGARDSRFIGSIRSYRKWAITNR